MRRAGKVAAIVVIMTAAAATLTGCDFLPWSGGGDSSPSDAMVVEVEVTSDVPAANQVRVEIDARDYPKHLDLQDVALPYEETFLVPLETPFPLAGSTVEATVGQDASWVECRIVLDGVVVAEERAEGSGVTAVCEKKLRLGPQ